MTGQPLILVLDDEPMILLELCLSLEDIAAEALPASTLETAFDLLDARAPEAAILDVHLGQGITCEKLAEALRARGIPFLLHSADLVRQGTVIDRIGAEVFAKPACAERVAHRAVELARGPDLDPAARPS